MSNVLTKPLPKGCLYGVLLAFVLFLLLLIGNGVLLQMAFHLVSGWLFHAQETLPPFLAKWRVAVLPMGCLVIAVWLTHSFICRWAKAKRPDFTWQIKYTVSIFLLLFLSSAAAIAMSGIVHQLFWLSKEDVIIRRGIERIHIRNETRNLCLFMFHYHQQKGRYPQDWKELETWDINSYVDGWCLQIGDVPEPFILLRQTMDNGSLEKLPLVVSPYIQSEDKYVMGYSDGSVRLVEPAMLKRILSESEEPKNVTPHE